jgi:hypothetical protein
VVENGQHGSSCGSHGTRVQQRIGREKIGAR